jgi:uncharacterized protein (DUF1330 family)
MLTRIRPRLVADVARRDLPGPLDVINLIHTERFDRYRWYALLVWPALSAVGGRVQWMGRLERAIDGEAQAEKLLVVRYPSHRHFLAMTMNPYYLAINRLREAGVRRFEASFTHASVTAPDLLRRRELIGAHFSSPPGEDALEQVRAILEPVAGELVYATRAVASLNVLDPVVATDPHPLTHGELALFAPAEDADDAAIAACAVALADVTAGCALGRYRREPRSTYRPSLRPAAVPAASPGR